MDINKYNSEEDIKRIEENVTEFLRVMWEIEEDEKQEENKQENK